VEVIAATPATLRALMDAISGERAEQPRAPGAWDRISVQDARRMLWVAQQARHPPLHAHSPTLPLNICAASGHRPFARCRR
jgi:hypothetical protein